MTESKTPDISAVSPFAREDGVPTNYHSFILRCWQSPQGEMRVRLIDTLSGRAYSLAALPDVPGLIERLVSERSPSSPEEEI